MTHGIDYQRNQMVTGPVHIGHHAMVGGNVKIVLGARIPSRSVVAMGATVIAGLEQDCSLYAGTPAVLKKRLLVGDYFERSVVPCPAIAHDDA